MTYLCVIGFDAINWSFSVWENTWMFQVQGGIPDVLSCAASSVIEAFYMHTLVRVKTKPKKTIEWALEHPNRLFLGYVWSKEI